MHDPVHLIVILCLNVFVSHFVMLMINKRVGIRGMNEKWEREREIEKWEIVASVHTHTVLKIG